MFYAVCEQSEYNVYGDEIKAFYVSLVSVFSAGPGLGSDRSQHHQQVAP